MLNKKAILSLARFLEKLPQTRFNMDFWIRGDGNKYPERLEDGNTNPIPTKPNKPSDPDCGTACCIAGWQVARMGYFMNFGGQVFKKKGKEFEWMGEASEVAGGALGLDRVQQRRLFRDFSITTPKEAARVLRNLLLESPDSEITNA